MNTPKPIDATTKPTKPKPGKQPAVMTLAMPQDLREEIEQHTGRLDESSDEFVIGAIRQRLQFLTAGMDPKTAGLRALNRALEVMGRNGFNRLVGVRTLAHQICGPAFYGRLEPLAHSCGMTPEEMLLLVMARKYKVDASWVIPDAERIAQTGMIANQQSNGGVK